LVRMQSNRMDYIDLVQWPAMILTAAAAWLVGSLSKIKRNVGFWVFLASNVLWVIWGVHAHAYALIVLQVVLAALNIRGVQKNDPDYSTTIPDALTSKKSASRHLE
jgi:hypothetical protein